MTPAADLFALIARLRREQPRNPRVHDLCDRAEQQDRKIAEQAQTIEQQAREIVALRANAADNTAVANVSSADAVSSDANERRQHRRTYMRMLMRKKRAVERAQREARP
jgi:hypothetical protein